MLVTLAIIAMLGISAAAIWYPTFPSGKAIQVTGTEISGNNSISIEQSVQGQGYNMQYMYAKAGHAELKEYAHGSGSLDQESILSSYHTNKTNHLVDANYNDFDQDCIQFQQTVNSWTYAPFNTIIGAGYYAQPVDYDSLLKEKTWVKNKLVGTSIQNEIEYAHAMKKDISAIVKATYNMTYDPRYEEIGFTEMKIDEDVTDGKIHIGALQANANPKFNMAIRNPDLEIDEDFIGTYHIMKNITIYAPYLYNKPAYDWLPCCSGGWDSIPSSYKTGFGSSAKGIFDCTCLATALSKTNPKWDGTAAQFPR